MAETLAIILVVLIVAIALDGVRRMRAARRDQVKLGRRARKADQTFGQLEGERCAELPTGKARRITRSPIADSTYSEENGIQDDPLLADSTDTLHKTSGSAAAFIQTLPSGDGICSDTDEREISRPGEVQPETQSHGSAASSTREDIPLLMEAQLDDEATASSAQPIDKPTHASALLMPNAAGKVDDVQQDAFAELKEEALRAQAEQHESGPSERQQPIQAGANTARGSDRYENNVKVDSGAALVSESSRLDAGEASAAGDDLDPLFNASPGYRENTAAAENAAQASPLSDETESASTRATSEKTAPQNALATARVVLDPVHTLDTDDAPRLGDLNIEGVSLDGLDDAVDGRGALKSGESIEATESFADENASSARPLAGLSGRAISLSKRLKNPFGEKREDVDSKSKQKRGRSASGVQADPLDDPQEIIALHVMSANGQSFDGGELRETLSRCGLRYGDMKIFHAFNEDERSIFSVASAVMPGSFDLTDTDSFSVPGISFFMALPNAGSSLQSFDCLVHIAKRIANALDGELRDESRNPMRQQTIEHYRQRVAEFERQQRLAHA